MIVCISHAKVGHPQAKLLNLENLSESWGFLVYTHMVVDRLNLITLRDVKTPRALIRAVMLSVAAVVKEGHPRLRC